MPAAGQLLSIPDLLTVGAHFETLLRGLTRKPRADNGL